MSIRSPKHKFSATATFDRYIDGIGQSMTVTADTLEGVESLIKDECARIKCGGAYVQISENTDTYPKFNRVKVNGFNLNLQ